MGGKIRKIRALDLVSTSVRHSLVSLFTLEEMGGGSGEEEVGRRK